MPDEQLRRFATPRQWEILEAIEAEGGITAASRKLSTDQANVSRAAKAVRDKAARAGYAPEHAQLHQVPDGYKIKGVSTLWSEKTGQPVLQWVKTSEDRERQLALLREGVRALCDELPRLDPVPAPALVAEDLCAAYPVGDHHLGMYAWAEEAGGDYDLKIGERLLNGAVDYLMAATPACGSALLPFLGDYLHYDSFASVTPTNRNLLDSDTRFPAMVRAAIRTMRRTVDAAVRRHGRVHVIVEIGNHDLAASVFLAEALAALYEAEPRVVVDTSPRQFHYFEFGAVLVGTHHGHGVKLADLPLLMATDQPERWGAARHRYWWTGHVHRDVVQDFAGCRVESFRVLPPADAWAANQGYRPRSDMKAVVLHREHGEVARHTVSPAMLGG